MQCVVLLRWCCAVCGVVEVVLCSVWCGGGAVQCVVLLRWCCAVCGVVEVVLCSVWCC